MYYFVVGVLGLFVGAWGANAGLKYVEQIVRMSEIRILAEVRALKGKI